MRAFARTVIPDFPSSPTLPADLATNFDRIAQAEFEEAVADGSYVAGPDFEWESEDAREGL